MTLIGISGHQDLPAEDVAEIRQRMRDHISRADDPQGISSLAAGADQLFAEELLAAGASLHAVVPAADYESAFDDEASRAHYRKLLSRAASVERLNFDTSTEDAYWAAGRRVVDRADELLAVWDGQPARGLGGTADVVDYARARDKPVTVIWPDGAQR